MKKFCFILLILGLVNFCTYSDSENANGYPLSCDPGAYNPPPPPPPPNPTGDEGGETGSHQGGQQGGGPQEDTTATYLTRESDSLSSQVDGEQSEVSAIQTGEVSTAADEAAWQEAALSGEVSEAAAETAAEITENNSNSQNEANSSNSDKAGDPVKISKGTYELSETDLTIGSNKLFSINRRYESEKTVCGSFGFGWHTNLDERIIIGTNPAHHKNYDALVKYFETLSALIRQTEYELSVKYKVSNIYDAPQEIAARISRCDNHIRILNSLISELASLRVQATNYYSIKSKIERSEGKAENAKSEVENKKHQLEACLEKITTDLEILNALKQKAQNAMLELKSKETLIIEDMERHKRNQKAMFSGMSKMYEETGIGTITVIDAEGYPHILKENNGIWQADNDKLYLRCVADGKQLVLYEKNGFLISIKDRNENTVKLLRGSNGNIKHIKTSDNEVLAFEYSGDFIAKVSNARAPEENVVYSYKGKRLESVKDTDDDIVGMKYDSDGHLMELNKCDGSSVKFSYDEQTFDGKNLTTVTTNEEGSPEYFDYNLAEKRTDYVDHDGNCYSYFYDDKHRTIKEIHPEGKVILNDYDAAGNLVCQNINGSRTHYEYDDNSNKILALYEDGTNEKWTYDNYNLVTSYINRDKVCEEFFRDSKGNLNEYRKGGKTVFVREYDSKGAVISQTVYGEHPIETKYQYDSFGNLIEETCGTNKKEYKYDSRNRITHFSVNGKTISEYEYKTHEILRTDYNGLAVKCVTNGRKDVVKIIQKDCVSGKIHQLRLEYDKRHLPVKMFIGDGDKEKLRAAFSYSAEGKLISEILYGNENIIKEFDYKDGQITELRQYKESEGKDNAFITKYESRILNKNHNRITVTDALGIQNTFEYDSYGNLLKKINGNGEEHFFNYSGAGLLTAEQTSYGGWYEYAYDSSSNLIKQKEEGGVPIRTSYYPNGSLKTVTDRYDITTAYHYDKQGRLTSEESIQRKIWYKYDSFNRLTKKIIGSDLSENNAVYYETYEYAEDGRAVTEVKGGKYKTVKKLDAFGNVVRIVDGENNERSFVYNEQNQLIEIFDGYGYQTSYEYDAIGKLSKKIVPDYTETNYTYNATGQLQKITDGCGIVYSAEFDASGRLIKEKRRADAEKRYEYDRAGRLIKVFCGNEILESYNYSDKGRTVRVSDGNQNDYRYFYDSFGRLVSEQNRKNYNQNYSYDAEGKLKSKNDFSENTTRISYSTDRSIRTVSYTDGSKNQFIYDATGNLLEAVNAYGHTVYNYDQAGYLIHQKELTTGEEISYEYDKAGNRTRLTSSNRDTIYTYGKNNELKEIFDNKQKISVKLAYNKNGMENLRKYGNGTKEETLYDTTGRVILKTLKSERNELLWGEGYVYGEDGKRIASVDNNARLTLYEYNAKGQLSSVFYPYSEELIQNQKNEAMLNGLFSNAEIGENRFLSSAEKSEVIPLLNSMQYGLAYKLTNLQIFIKESYSYDANGNRKSKTTSYGTIEYCYDKENCLVSSGSKGQAYVNYTSDKMGNLLSEESVMKKTEYSYNAQNRLSYCESIDKTEKTYAQTVYAYDAFGRRILVQDKNSPVIHTLYDGMSFEVVKEYSGNNIQWEKSGKPTGDRYRYLDDEENYKIADSRYYGERTQLYANNSIAAQFTVDFGTEYFSTDLLGSIRSATDSYGNINTSLSYDAFGSVVNGKLTGSTEYGYLGKPLDPTTSHYNYGYRDYNPTAARFTTIDPIRDSTNWFTYCNGDPINFIDPDGLFFYSGNVQQSYKKTTVYVIRNDDGTGNEFNSSLYIRKEDVFGNVTYSDPYSVGANCKTEYDGKKGSTTPDGTYYLSDKGTSDTPLYRQEDGTVNSTSFKNTLSLRTSDERLTQEQKDMINTGDRLLHADEYYDKNTGTTRPYNNDGTPGGAGCIINHTQTEHDQMMAEIMNGVPNPELVRVEIYSLSNMGCVK